MSGGRARRRDLPAARSQPGCSGDLLEPNQGKERTTGYAVVLPASRPLKPNEIEAHALVNGGEGGGDLFADGLAGTLATELGMSTVVVTLGESGCIAHAASVTGRYAAQKAVAVDTTGASDAFAAPSPRT